MATDIQKDVLIEAISAAGARIVRSSGRLPENEDLLALAKLKRWIMAAAPKISILTRCLTAFSPLA